MSSNKAVKLLNLVGWFTWIVRWCMDLLTSKLHKKLVSTVLMPIKWIYRSAKTLFKFNSQLRSTNGTWWKRYNHELYELFNDSNIVNDIKAKRLAWAGHLIRMSNERTLKKIFHTKPEGTRSVGRPKLRWEDGVVQDTRILGVSSWKKVALDRDEWAKLLKKARVHQGLSSQWWWWW
jgi:hypothetical protein